MSDAADGGYRPYPAYKASSIEWLGEVPEHWEVKRLKHLCSRSALYGANIAAPDYSLEGVRFLRTTDISDYGVLLEDNAVYVPADLVAGYMLADGDLLLSRSGTLGRSFQYQANLHGPCSYAGYLVRFVPTRNLYPKFAYFFTKSKAFEQWLSASTISSTIGNVNGQKYANLDLPLPPLPEQHAIAAFLDHKTAEIDTLIAAKERLITLLREKRAALITSAVTKGLDPDVAMKDSGVEWLGEVPEHWEVLDIKYLLDSIIDTEHKTAPFYDDGEYLVVRTTNVRDGRLVLDGAKYTDQDGFEEWTRRGMPKPGDILFTREAPAGEACVVPTNLPLCLGQRMVLFRVKHDVLDGRYGVFALYAGIAREFIRLLSQGSTVAHFNMADIGNIPILTPPVQEQEIIVQYLDKRMYEVDVLITKVQDGLIQLQEYRTALISAAVTGKIDVREEG